jgi:GNAT superfamily N-acetyltransferase
MTIDPQGLLPPAGPDSSEEIDALRDGTRVRIRRVYRGDRRALEDFLARLSPESFEQRFFAAVSSGFAAEELLRVASDAQCVAVLMETVGETRPRIVAHAEFVRGQDGRPIAEAAFLVADEFQGKGAATLLLWHLARAARARGIRTLEAVTQVVNVQMLRVAFDAGYPFKVTRVGDMAWVTLDISSERQLAICPVPPPTNAASA